MQLKEDIKVICDEHLAKVQKRPNTQLCEFLPFLYNLLSQLPVFPLCLEKFTYIQTYMHIEIHLNMVYFSNLRKKISQRII